MAETDLERFRLGERERSVKNKIMYEFHSKSFMETHLCLFCGGLCLGPFPCLGLYLFPYLCPSHDPCLHPPSPSSAPCPDLGPYLDHGFCPYLYLSPDLSPCLFLCLYESDLRGHNIINPTYKGGYWSCSNHCYL